MVYFWTETLVYFWSEINKKSTFDTPRSGDGYCLGARNIKEQNGVLEILKMLNVNSSYLKWALTEVFTINDDVFRYVRDFGEIQAQLLSYYEDVNEPHIDDFYKAIAQITSSEDLKDDRIEYLNCFKNQISSKGIKTIQGYLLSKNIPWDVESVGNNPNNDSEVTNNDCFDKFNHKLLKYDKANRENLIKEGTQAFIKERVNMWLGNWSTSSNVAKSKLKQLFIDEFEVFKYLKEFINFYSNDPWSITSKLIWFLEGKLTIDKTEEIYKTIAKHFSLLIRPDEETIAKYNWIEDKTFKGNNDELLAKFLIWFLNHPNEGILTRTFNAIKKLVIYEPDLMIPFIIEEIASSEPNASPLKCSLILKDISFDKPELISSILEKENDCFHKLVNVKHFTIKKNILDSAINLNKIGYNRLYNKIYRDIPDTIILVGDVALDEKHLEAISYEINELNYMQILNREFCESLLKTIEIKCRPLSIAEFRKSDKYLRRSFPNDTYYSGRFEEILRYSLNISITNRVDKRNLNEVYNILNS